MRTQLVFNRFQQAKNSILEAVGAQNVEAAEVLARLIAGALDAGEGITSDTHALAKSLYVEATGRDDYAGAVAAAKRAMQENPSRHREGPVTQKGKQSFAALIAARSGLPDDGDRTHFMAAVATALAYGAYWEHYQDRPWMMPAVRDALPQLRAVYEQLRGKITL